VRENMCHAFVLLFVAFASHCSDCRVESAYTLVEQRHWRNAAVALAVAQHLTIDSSMSQN
jgi:hypothetical protein